MGRFNQSAWSTVFLWLLMLAGHALAAQTWEQRISCRYSAVPLEDVLADLSKKHDVRFAYSPEFIPAKAPVSLEVRQQPLIRVLDQILEPLPVDYQILGRQAVLRYSGKSSGDKLGSKTLPLEVPQKTPLYTDPRLQQIKEERQQKWREELPVLTASRTQGSPLIPGKSTENPEGDLGQYRLPPPPSPAAQPAPSSRLAQISLLPYLGSNVLQSPKLSNRLSFNLLWGFNGGVEGLEIGGLVNTIRYDVRGIQIAGWGNMVGGDVTGIQYGGLFNFVGDTISGVQLAGLFNAAGRAYAIQGAAGFNLAFSGFSGIQASGAFNYCGGANSGIQASGLLNISRGKVKAQFSGLGNIAGQVEQAQAGLINIARKQEGSQFGIINVADTVAGVSIGLLSFIRKGYHSLEIGGGETFHGNFALRLGVPRFYNIFYLGTRLDDRPASAAGKSAGTDWSWGLGYGIGTTFPLGRRSTLHLEGVSIHLNERALWDPALNQLQQLRLTFDTPIAPQVHFYAGPAAYYLISRRKDPESGIFQTDFAPYAWWSSQQDNGTTRQFWGGLTAGIRILSPASAGFKKQDHF